ncbi:MAG: hypothetical protein CL675_13280 [Bdellovibrionaceae bacterium]|nr:hypothetical protein [Pseudobdellovibrionaceae bacterium]MAE75059.1 hypothetical protein [Pseudobdellovibrionaceae bacterium]
MTKAKYILICILTVGYVIGCSEVEFAPTPPDVTCQLLQEEDPDLECDSSAGTLSLTDEITLGKVDILFVNDNSGSMSTEQRKIANRFNMFIERLDDQNVDYQIAITTTDVSGVTGGTSSVSQSDLKNGNFIIFGNGQTVLTNQTIDRVQLFKDAIQREETEVCEDSNFTNCPSGDERAIYAANLVLDRADPSFFRKDAHFAVVILSDEDERSAGGRGTNSPQLENLDLPETLLSKVRNQLGDSKAVSVHPIIVRPGDSGCLSQQSSQGNQFIFGYEGKVYARFVNDSAITNDRTLIPGVLGNICASDYANQLRDIAGVISEVPVQLECTPVSDPQVEAVAGIPAGTQIYFDSGSGRIHFSPAVPSGGRIRVKYECPDRI